MNREELLKNICPANPIDKYDICTKSKCDRCNIMLNEMLNEYDILIKADAIDECKNIVIQTLDNEGLADTLLLRMEMLNEKK